MTTSSADLPAAAPDFEVQRLRALDQARLLDTEPEAEFDDLVHLAAEICGTPVSLFSLVGSERQWFKAAHGLATKETPRSVSFCAHAMGQDGMFEVRDALDDPRFCQNYLVTGLPGIRFYAAVPVKSPDGFALGTLCVIDTEPRCLTPTQAAALAVLARQVTARVALREQQHQLTEALAHQAALTRNLRSSEARFKAFMNAGPFLSFLKDEQGRFVYYNQTMAKEFGLSEQEWLGKTVHDLFPKELADEYRKLDLDAMAAGTVVDRIELTRDAAGVEAHWKSYKFPVRDEDDNAFLGGISIDVTHEIEREKALKDACGALERLASTDSLTGLLNRRTMEQELGAALERAKAKGSAVSVVMLDIDHFKQLNDIHGHAAGDAALRSMGVLIGASLRRTDLAARYGGEEFVVMLADTGLDGAWLYAERLKAALADSIWPNGRVTASFGITCAEKGMESVSDLIDQADRAMYVAKARGRNSIVAHDRAVSLAAA